jgi:uncharacterized protein (DUF608 family)
MKPTFLPLFSAAMLAGFAGLAADPVPAGKLDTAGFSKLIPADKQLPPDWVKSLTERGAPTVYTGDALMKIGMPVGGLCCGTLYLGGDGKLWLWDIFNRNQEGAVGRTVNYGGQKVPPRNGACYVVPPTDQPSPLEQGFALRVKMAGGEPQIRTLDRKGWNDVRFTGSYPVGTVDYADPACPVQVRLQAFSPFIPLNVDDSSLPATIMRYTITNTGKQAVTVDIGGWLENTVLKSIGDAASRSNRHMNTKLISSLICMAGNAPAEAGAALRPDIVFEDFEKETYEGWTVKGTAFGTGPISKDKVPAYQGDLGMVGNRAVNSHACAPGTDLGVKDGQTGSLLSREFTIERNYLRFLIGGGNHPPKTCLNLLVDGKIVRTATGHNNNQMRQEAFNVRDLAGKKAQIEILDQESGAWANIGIDQIVFSDRSGLPPMVLEKRPDFGSMTLSVLDMQPVHSASPIDPAALPGALFAGKTEATGTDRLIGGMVCREQTINPGKSATITFAITWYFPNVRFGIQGDDTGRHYSKKFADAEAVAEYLATNQKRLIDTTLLWRDTWYESSLPCWFLDRTFANTSILATTTAHRFANGRFYAWEGIGCCPGTCSHVWHYGQAMGRIFPELERNVREQVDFGLAFDDNSGVIGYRAEHGRGPATDGQCGRILGMLREHQMSPDNQFLKHNWPRVKMAILYLMHHDLDNDGILDGAQENTLDAAWFGQIPWISGLYAAALMAGKEMATDMNDFEFARDCELRALQSRMSIEQKLFNGEWFIQTKDPAHPKAFGSYNGCAIDQVFGQSWAWQVGLDRVLGKEKTVSALQSLWKYNFALDLGPFINGTPTKGRPYCVPGEGGLVMVTNPLQEAVPYGDNHWTAMYFSECMSGFEHQVASHMIAEGMVTEGLAVTRAIHDRYRAEKRNPYNEVECSDHYARAMASYGSFISACGFTSHGPKGMIGFAPRLSPQDFKAAFTAAGGWGTFSQKQAKDSLEAALEVKYGAVTLHTVRLALPAGMAAKKAEVKLGQETIASTVSVNGGTASIDLKDFVTVPAGKTLSIVVK